MRRQIASALLVVWWIATPAVCGAFLTTASCPAQARAQVDLAPSVPTGTPCHGHGESELPTQAPDGEQASCCDGVDLAVSVKLVLESEQHWPVLQMPSADQPRGLAHKPILLPHAVDELRSPFRRTSPPLLN